MVGMRRSDTRVRSWIADGQVGRPDSRLSWLPGAGHEESFVAGRFLACQHNIIAALLGPSVREKILTHAGTAGAGPAGQDLRAT